MHKILLPFVIGASLFCCERGKPIPFDAADVEKPDTVPSLIVQDSSGLLFSFFNNRAELKTVDRIEQIEKTALDQVMVTEPRTHLPKDLIYVADLSSKNEAGQYRVWVEPRGKWYDRVVPKTSQISAELIAEAKAKLEARSKVKRGRRPTKRQRLETKDTAVRTGASKAPKVILFATSWCPSCRAARSFFKLRGVPFKEVDVEKDAQAREQYLSIEQSFRLKPGVVPLIMVNGRPFQGFSQPQIEAALSGG